MTTFTVTTALDTTIASDGVLSLREAVAQANATSAADTIVFAGSLEGETLTLTGGELVLRQSVTIDLHQNNDGIGASVSGGGSQRIFRTDGPGAATVTLNDLELTGGFVNSGIDGGGGAIHVGGYRLNVSNCIINDNTAYGAYGGGGIFAENGSQVVISGTVLADNRGSNGGAVHALSGTSISLRDCVLQRNRAVDLGGAIYQYSGEIVVENSVLDSNSTIDYHVGHGGALSLRSAHGTISSSTISNNYSNRGGGIFFGNTLTGKIDLTIANNVVGSSYASGGGLVWSEPYYEE